MLSRVPPGDHQPAKRLVQDVARPVDDLHDHDSFCGLTSVSRSTVSRNTGPVVNYSASQFRRVQSRDELPILRAQYVARGVRVLFGSRWRLNRFQERTIVLRTGAEPTLSVYAADNHPGAPPEVTYVLDLDTKCALTRSNGSSHSRGASGIQLSNTTSSAFRLRIRFNTAADASIWRSIVREALAHARWSSAVRPVKQKQKASRRRNIRVVQHAHSSQRFVVKTLTKNNESGDCHELQILRRLYNSSAAQDVSLVRQYRVVETDEEMLLIMPQLPGITLLQFLRQRRRQNNQKLSDEEGRLSLARLAPLLQAVHQSGIVHCDLNLENVIVSQNLSYAWLIDFGGARNFLDSHQNKEMTGTPGFVAPERVLDPLIPPTPKADVFSLGILLFQALTGQHPYLDAIRDKRSLELPDSLCLDLARVEEILTVHAVSPELRDLVGEMLKTDPQTRISLDKVLAMVCCTGREV